MKKVVPVLLILLNGFTDARAQAVSDVFKRSIWDIKVDTINGSYLLVPDSFFPSRFGIFNDSLVELSYVEYNFCGENEQFYIYSMTLHQDTLFLNDSDSTDNPAFRYAYKVQVHNDDSVELKKLFPLPTRYDAFKDCHYLDSIVTHIDYGETYFFDDYYLAHSIPIYDSGDTVWIVDQDTFGFYLQKFPFSEVHLLSTSDSGGVYILSLDGLQRMQFEMSVTSYNPAAPRNMWHTSNSLILQFEHPVYANRNFYLYFYINTQ